MKVKIKDRREIAKGMLEVTFDNTSKEVVYSPGQFCKVTLINPPHTDARGDGRFLGFTSSPSMKDAFTVLTKIGVSGFKKSLIEIPLGTEVDISGIDGRLKLPEDRNQPLVFVAGNIGIAPIMGILRYSHETLWPHNITLIYVNQNRDEAAFFGELENFAKETDKFKFIPAMTNDQNWQGEKRPINSAFIKEYFPQPEKNLYFVTGAPAFVPVVFREIKDAGVPVLNLRMEIFTGY